MSAVIDVGAESFGEKCRNRAVGFLGRVKGCSKVVDRRLQ
ncbi:MAG: hypothetical protein QOE61_2129 [Micromonosporaceae bacterium]|nr:hypothetical protein [Micromonosporaceae bacterium]